MQRQVNEALIEKITLKVKKLREEKGISLQAFYNDTGIHLARIESERRDMPISTLSRICEYFGMTLSDFLKGM
jgi:transcriptional regulator with XRE-family HTH domain